MCYYEIASQVIRDLMFTQRTHRMRSIDELTDYIGRRYSPQMSPPSLRDVVVKEYIDWLKHFIRVPESCPDVKAAKAMYKHLDGFDAIENHSNVPF